MTRVAVLLLLAALASAQGTAALVGKALDPETAPSERTKLLADIAKSPEGRLELARRGLAPDLDPEVVHAVVEVLLSAEDPGEHLEPICRLLLSPPHRDKVQERIERVAESPASAKRLVAKLSELALGGTAESAREPTLRTAAVRALASVPLRAAVEVVLQVWKKDPEAAVKEECRAALDGVVDAGDAEDAERYLAERPFATYYQLVKEVSRLRRQREAEAMRRMERQLRSADVTVAFEALADANGEIRRAASERVHQLADAGVRDGKVGGMPAEAFAKAVFDHFRAELARGENLATIAHLCESLATLAVGGASSPLLKSVPADDLTRAVQGIAERDADWRKVGEAAVRVLGAQGEPARGVLVRFARNAGSAEVRRLAALSLGDLARNSENSRPFVGQSLAELLGKEGDPEVRQQILLSLRNAPVDVAVEPIRTLLFPEKPDEGAALSEPEPKYCIEILALIHTPAALEVLFRLTREADPDVRALAAVAGLVPRANGNADHERVREHLREMVLGPDQPAEVRERVLAGLGEDGRRGADAILREAARAEGLEEALHAAAVEARLRLAERLAVPEAEAEDLALAATILREEWDGTNSDRIEPIARDIVQAGDDGKKAVGDARALVALLQRAKRPEDVEGLQPLFNEARAKADVDRMSPQTRQRLLLENRDLLKQVPPEKRAATWVEVSRGLAGLAREDRQQAWGYWLDAIEGAVVEMKERTLADSLVKEMTDAIGLPDGPAGARWTAVQEKLQALPPKVQ